MPTHLNVTAAPLAHLSGVVYSALLNDPRQLAELGEATTRPPYKAPPLYPVLAVRPRNTLTRHEQAIAVPRQGVRTGPSLGLVVGRTACRVPEAYASAYIAGYLIANDLCLPMAGTDRHYRPAVRQMARDGFCPLGTAVPSRTVTDPDDLTLSLSIDGSLVWEGSTAGRVRNVTRLLAEVSDFMTLQSGDVLLLGISADVPLALPGQTMSVTARGLGTLTNHLLAEAE